MNTERDQFSIDCFTLKCLQQLEWARSGWESSTQYGLLLGEQGLNNFNCQLLSPRVHMNGKLELDTELRFKPKYYDMGMDVLSAFLTTAPNIHPHLGVIQ